MLIKFPKELRMNSDNQKQALWRAMWDSQCSFKSRADSCSNLRLSRKTPFGIGNAHLGSDIFALIQLPSVFKECLADGAPRMLQGTRFNPQRAPKQCPTNGSGEHFEGVSWHGLLDAVKKQST